MSELHQIFDSKLFKVLSEPVRIDILKVLAQHGQMDIAGITGYLPQDRSVVSRHLSVMHDVGVLKAEKRGRHIFYELDGLAILHRLEGIATAIRHYFESCCPEALKDE